MKWIPTHPQLVAYDKLRDTKNLDLLWCMNNFVFPLNLLGHRFSSGKASPVSAINSSGSGGLSSTFQSDSPTCQPANKDGFSFAADSRRTSLSKTPLDIPDFLVGVSAIR